MRREKLTARFMVALSERDKGRLERLAERNGNTLAGFVRWILRQYMQGKEGER